MTRRILFAGTSQQANLDIPISSHDCMDETLGFPGLECNIADEIRSAGKERMHSVLAIQFNELGELAMAAP